MRPTTSVPKLAQENASLVVHSLHNEPPSIDLVLNPDASNDRESNRKRGRNRCFPDKDTALSYSLREMKSAGAQGDRTVAAW
jgi:hypothetical protein